MDLSSIFAKKYTSFDGVPGDGGQASSRQASSRQATPGSSLPSASPQAPHPAPRPEAKACSFRCASFSTAKRFAGLPVDVPGMNYLSSRQATPGSSLPSMNSREAPPPVEMWVILSA